MCAVFPHCRSAGFAAEQSRKNIGVYMVWAVLAGLDFSGVECLLCLLKQFLGDNRFVHTLDDNPILPVILHPFFCAVGRCVLSALHHAPNKHLILQHGSDICLTPVAFTDKSPVFLWVVVFKSVVLCGGEYALIVKGGRYAP